MIRNKMILPMAIITFLFTTLFANPVFSETDLPSMIGITTIGVGTASHSMTAAYAPILEEELGIKARAMPSDSTMVSFSQMRQGSALFGSLSTPSLVEALHGDAPYNDSGWGPQKVALVWVGYDGPFGFVVRKNSDIESIEDLKGKKLAWYEGSPAWQNGAKGALAFGGLTLDDVELVKVGDYSSAAKAVVQGKADADYLAPFSSVTYEIAEAPSGIRYLPMPLEDEEAWARYHEHNPLAPKGICGKGVKVARGVPMANHLFVNATYLDKKDEHIYKVAKFFGEKYDSYKDRHDELKDMSIKKMKEYLETESIPVHPGTVKYLKEINVWTEKDDKWNNELIELAEKYNNAWNKAMSEAKEKEIKVDSDNEDWVELWDAHRKGLPRFSIKK